jgi:glycosyltransferase involved in cell wall biosynthesis
MLAYVTTYDSTDPTLWAGTGYYIARALERQGFTLLRIGPLRERQRHWNKLRQVLYQRLLGRALHRDREPAVLDGFADQITAAIALRDVRAIVSPGAVPIANLKTNLPIVVWADATYGGIVDFYRWEAPPSARSRRLGNAMEQRALDACAAVVFASDWAADSARQLYHIPDSKLHVIPYGANIVQAPDPSAIDAAIDARPQDRCRLLFIGTGWQRKGGDVAIQVAQKLVAAGLPTDLAIVSADAPDPSELPPVARRVAFIDKRTSQGQTAFADLLSSSHFLLHPARADALGIVLAEASAFGVPSITTQVGGIPTLIRDGVNGRLFTPDDPDAMAHAIQNLMRDPVAYRALCRSAHAEYQRRLNWDVAGARMKSLLDRLIA